MKLCVTPSISLLTRNITTEPWEVLFPCQCPASPSFSDLDTWRLRPPPGFECGSPAWQCRAFQQGKLCHCHVCGSCLQCHEPRCMAIGGLIREKAGSCKEANDCLQTLQSIHRRAMKIIFTVKSPCVVFLNNLTEQKRNR